MSKRDMVEAERFWRIVMKGIVARGLEALRAGPDRRVSSKANRASGRRKAVNQ
ncbi:MAG: hypothetical protein HY943_01335 [Gammaproteobacteria bacterium]|nr:hypothetical protein [Gammaproteobacteria bacterium]